MPEPITPAATRSVIDDDSRQVALIDIREPLDYSEGHIYESTPVPRRDLEVRLPIVVPGGQATIVLIDEAGDRAEDDAEWLEVLGYSDVRYLDGGMAAWVEAGYETVDAHDGVYATAFNFPSKDFGERVEVEDEPEKLSPDEFKALREDQDVLLADVRTPEEFEESTIPGALHIEGVDVGLYLDTLREDDQPVVVHCGGRTRSIIGASTLQKLGFEEVYELENGTMGWDLAGFDLEHGADRHIRDLDLDSVTRDSIRERVADLLEQTDVSYLSAAEFSDLLANDELLYPVDVRTADEYAASHIPGSLSIPGGQAIQTTDEHFAVRNGTVVFISDDGIRAGITAYWFDRMGFPRVFVLEGGLDAWEAAGEPVETGSTTRKPPDSGIVKALVEEITPAELDQLRSTQ
ncbi:MAG: rhodanese-like domain-containing protein, partial [Salinirussus sp.]